jgi:DNA-binding Lrp family transcriptional regulator
MKEITSRRLESLNKNKSIAITLMGRPSKESTDKRVRDAYSVHGKIDVVDVNILEGLSLLGPRNLSLIAKHLGIPTTTVRYRVKRMLDQSILFLHLNPFHTNMGLRKAVVFASAVPGHENILLDCMKENDYWLSIYRLYGPYEGVGGTWTIPRDNVHEFKQFMQSMLDFGVANLIEINWTTCHEGIPVQTRWYNSVDRTWNFEWDEWTKEVETIKGKLPWTMVEPDDWPIRVDYDDLLIIKELEIDGKRSLTEISKNLNRPLETIKYHFREHVSKRKLIEGYQIEIYRYPSLTSEYVFFKFEFHCYEGFKRFALSLHDKPFPIWMGKVIGENAMMAQFYLPRWEFRKFIGSLGDLINKGLLIDYHYVFEDMFNVWRETIPYQHFKDGEWEYDFEGMIGRVKEVLGRWKIDLGKRRTHGLDFLVASTPNQAESKNDMLD